MAHLILSIVLAVLFLATGTPKILGVGYAIKNRDALHLTPAFWRLAGSLEVLGAIGLIAGIWISPIGIAAASGLTLFMIGAALSRLRATRIDSAPVPVGGMAADIAVALVCAADVVLIALGI
jgi:uncharacterized membrane protein YphA (DoxX/SURF4 family)